MCREFYKFLQNYSLHIRDSSSISSLFFVTFENQQNLTVYFYYPGNTYPRPIRIIIFLISEY